MLCTCGSPLDNKTLFGIDAVYLFALMPCTVGTHAVYLQQPMMKLKTYAYGIFTVLRGADAVYCWYSICVLMAAHDERKQQALWYLCSVLLGTVLLLCTVGTHAVYFLQPMIC